MPVDSGLGIVSSRLPSIHFVLDFVEVIDSAVQALLDEHVEFDLGHIEPTAVLWRVMPFETPGETARLGGLEGFIKRGRSVRVEIVLNEDNPFGPGKMLIRQFLSEHARNR